MARPSRPRRPPLVVIVDDDEALRDALKFNLELDGYRVETCDTAEAVLNLDLPKDGLCLVLDDSLSGLPGLYALDLLRRRGVEAPAILLASGQRLDLSAAAAAGVAIVEKPLLNGALQAAIRAAFGR